MTRLGCPNGCPLDYHEPTCQTSWREAEEGQKRDQARQSAATQAIYDLGYRAGHEAGYAAGLAAARKEPTVIRVEPIAAKGDPA